MANVKNADDILIGTGRMYIEGSDVGQLDGDITFTHGKTFYEKKSGFPASTVKKVLTEEKFTAAFNLLEANLDTIRLLMPDYPLINVAAEGTPEAVTVSVTVQSGRSTFIGTRNITTITSVKKGTTALVEGTDYEIDKLEGTIYRVSTSSAIADGDTVTIVYNHAAQGSKRGFGIGGAQTSNATYLVEFWHKRSDGKYRHIKIWKCLVDGDFAMAFKEQADSPLAMTITALVDSTKDAGHQLAEVTEEPATNAPGGGW